MSVFKRGGFYYYEFTFKGRRVKASTRLTNKQAAVQLEAQRRTELVQGRMTVAAPLFSVFVKEEFLPWSAAQHQKINTRKRYMVSAKSLSRFFGKLSVDEISAADIEHFKVQRVRECSATGVNRDLAALRFMMNFAKRQRYLTTNPLEGIDFYREGPGMMRIVSHEEEQRYLDHAPPLLKDVATLMLQTGMRPEEVFNIRDENVHLQRAYIFVPQGKTPFARRTIPLTTKAAEILSRRMRKGYLFPHKEDPNKPMVCLRSHKTLIKKLQLTFRLYDFRHTFGSRSAMAGVDLATLKELMGHSTITLTMRYVHPTPEHKKEAMRKLEAFNTPPKSPTSDIMATRKSRRGL